MTGLWRVAGGEGCHIEQIADFVPSALDVAIPSMLAPVVVVGRDPDSAAAALLLMPPSSGSRAIAPATNWAPNPGTLWMIAAWIARPGATLPNKIAEVPSTLTLPATRIHRAWAIDLMNGTEQELAITRRENETVISNLLVKSYPTLIRLLLW